MNARSCWITPCLSLRWWCSAHFQEGFTWLRFSPTKSEMLFILDFHHPSYLWARGLIWNHTHKECFSFFAAHPDRFRPIQRLSEHKKKNLFILLTFFRLLMDLFRWIISTSLSFTTIFQFSWTNSLVFMMHEGTKFGRKSNLSVDNLLWILWLQKKMLRKSIMTHYYYGVPLNEIENLSAFNESIILGNFLLRSTFSWNSINWLRTLCVSTAKAN